MKGDDILRVKFYNHNEYTYALPDFLLDPDLTLLDKYINKLKSDPEFAVIIGLMFAEHFALRRDNGFASLYDYLVLSKDHDHIYDHIKF